MAHARDAFEALRHTGGDQVTGVGVAVELEARIDPVRARLAHTLRFAADGVNLGEAELDELGWARMVFCPSEAGRFRIEAEALTRSGASLGGVSGVGTLTVVGEQPVVAVDAAALDEASICARLGALRRGDATLVVLALTPSERTTVRAKLTEVGLGGVPVLGMDLATRRMPTLGVDFGPTLARSLVRRLRTNHVAVVAFVSPSIDLGEGTLGGLGETAAGSDLEVAHRQLRAAADGFHHRRRECASELSFRLDEATGSRLVPGNACAVELDNGAARRALLHAIDDAREEILLSVYILEEGRFVDRLAYALVAAARRGVKVRVLVDALYSKQDLLGAQNPVVAGLTAEPGVEILAVRPILSLDSLDPLLLKERDHRKVVVVDGRRGFVSGRNAGDAYYTGLDEVFVTDFTAHEHIPWLDAHVEVSGPLLVQIADTFRATFVEAGGDDFEPIRCDDCRGAMAARWVVHQGVGDTNAMGAYEALLDSARERVFIVNDFPIVDTLAAAARRAVARGAEVTLLTGSALTRRLDGSFFRGPLHREAFEHMTKRRLLPLVAAGVQVIEVVSPADAPVLARGGAFRPYVHAKVMTSDGRAVSVGSANLDATASYWEREAIVVVEDESLATRVEGELGALAARGVPLDPEDPVVKAEAPLRELASGLWPDSLYS